MPPATGPEAPAPPHPVPRRDQPPPAGPTPIPTPTAERAEEAAAAAEEHSAAPPDASNGIDPSAALSGAAVAESRPKRPRPRRIVRGVVIGEAPRP